jgi:D-alanyl-D-alanine carboxypeptidase
MPATLTGYVADQPLDFPPGSAYRYSNTDNIVVALFAEEATGLSYERVLDRLVLDPLAMRQTSLPLGFRLPTPFVHGYASNARGTREDFSEIINMSAIWASGGIVSAPLDTNRFVRAYAGGRLFGGAARAAQLEFRPGGGSDPPGPGQNAAGLALFRYRTRCGTVYGHTGNFPGYTAFTASSPNGSRSVAVLAGTQLDWNPQLSTRVGSHAAFDALRRAFELGVCSARA